MQYQKEKKGGEKGGTQLRGGKGSSVPFSGRGRKPLRCVISKQEKEKRNIKGEKKKGVSRNTDQ